MLVGLLKRVNRSWLSSLIDHYLAARSVNLLLHGIIHRHLRLLGRGYKGLPLEYKSNTPP